MLTRIDTLASLSHHNQGDIETAFHKFHRIQLSAGQIIRWFPSSEAECLRTSDDEDWLVAAGICAWSHGPEQTTRVSIELRSKAASHVVQTLRELCYRGPSRVPRKGGRGEGEQKSSLAAFDWACRLGYWSISSFFVTLVAYQPSEIELQKC